MLLTISFQSRLNWYWFSCLLLVFELKIWTEYRDHLSSVIFTPKHQFSHKAVWSHCLQTDKMILNSNRKVAFCSSQTLTWGFYMQVPETYQQKIQSRRRLTVNDHSPPRPVYAGPGLGAGPNCGGDWWKSKGPSPLNLYEAEVIPQNPGQKCDRCWILTRP